MTSLLGLVHDFVVEDGEVKSQSEPDRVGWLQFSVTNVSSILVRIEAAFGNILTFTCGGDLSEITVIIALPKGTLVETKDLHFIIEDFRVRILGAWDKCFLQKQENFICHSLQFFFDLGTACFNVLDAVVGLLLGFNGADNSPG